MKTKAKAKGSGESATGATELARVSCLRCSDTGSEPDGSNCLCDGAVQLRINATWRNFKPHRSSTTHEKLAALVRGAEEGGEA